MPKATFKAGFSDITLHSQEVFRTILGAMAQPGTVSKLRDGLLEAPEGLNYAATAVCLTLVDNESPIWLDKKAHTEESESYLRFHCGAVMSPSPAGSSFALLDSPDEMPALTAFRMGLPEYPDRSTTLILQVADIGQRTSQAATLYLKGPGIPPAAGEKALSISGLPNNFTDQWNTNTSLFPLGVDCILCSGDSIVCLPRTTTICKQESLCM